MFLFIGVPSLNLLIVIPTFIITFLLGQILALLIYSIIGLMAFFILNVMPIHWIVDKTVMVLGGSYLPISMFPKFMKTFAYFSPFGAINFTSSTVYSFWNNEYLIRILLQIAWIIIFGLLLLYTNKKAKEKALINGG